MKSAFISRALLSVSLLMPLSALALTIKVTTTEDQNGIDASKCSLREAVQSINTSMAFGGCPAGIPSADNTIALGQGVYVLSNELMISQEITIVGASTYRWKGDAFGTTSSNPLTGERVTRLRPLTTIKAAPGKRIINAASAVGDIELTDLVLDGGAPNSGIAANDNGGAILSGVSLSLENVRIQNSSAQRGGAIFLARAAGVSLTDTTFQSNSAVITGGAIAMSCVADGSSVVRSVSVQRSAFRDNSSAGAGAIDLCGDVTAGVVATTFSRNSSGATMGALTYGSQGGATDASISVDFSTLAEHGSGYAIASSGHAVFELTNSAFAGNGADCLMNGVALCSADNSLNKVAIVGLTEFEPAKFANFGGLSDGYLPKGTLVLDAVPTSGGDCAGTDQRNIGRAMGAGCDIGALERLQLAAVADKGRNVAGGGRIAYVDVLANDAFGEDGTGVGGVIKPVDFEIDIGLSDPLCAVEPANPGAGHPLPRLRLNNPLGVLTPVASPKQCQYRVKDAGGMAVGAPAVVEISLANISPVATNDSFMRPVGVPMIVLDILANDRDDGDNDAGLGIVHGTAVNQLIIKVVTAPQLGSLSGTEVACPGAALPEEAETTCYQAGPLRYTAANNMSPFADEFSYSVIDKDGDSSATARVVVNTDAKDSQSGGGAFDWLLLGMGVLLSGLRLSRRL